jgi:hypothetical protein
MLSFCKLKWRPLKLIYTQSSPPPLTSWRVVNHRQTMTGPFSSRFVSFSPRVLSAPSLSFPSLVFLFIPPPFWQPYLLATVSGVGRRDTSQGACRPCMQGKYQSDAAGRGRGGGWGPDHQQPSSAVAISPAGPPFVSGWGWDQEGADLLTAGCGADVHRWA